MVDCLLRITIIDTNQCWAIMSGYCYCSFGINFKLMILSVNITIAASLSMMYTIIISSELSILCFPGLLWWIILVWKCHLADWSTKIGSAKVLETINLSHAIELSKKWFTAVPTFVRVCSHRIQHDSMLFPQHSCWDRKHIFIWFHIDFCFWKSYFSIRYTLGLSTHSECYIYHCLKLLT